MKNSSWHPLVLPGPSVPSRQPECPRLLKGQLSPWSGLAESWAMSWSPGHIIPAWQPGNDKLAAVEGGFSLAGHRKDTQGPLSPDWMLCSGCCTTPLRPLGLVMGGGVFWEVPSQFSSWQCYSDPTSDIGFFWVCLPSLALLLFRPFCIWPFLPLKKRDLSFTG